MSDARAALTDDPATALREADRALRIDPELIGAYYAKAAALARFDEADAAKAALREAARREPRNFVTWALLGDLAVRTGDFDEARGLYRRALALNPRDPSLVVLRARSAKCDARTTDLPLSTKTGILSACAFSACLGARCADVAAIAAPAGAQEPGVFIDPGSPSAKEYAIPLESERRQADPAQGAEAPRSRRARARRRSSATGITSGDAPVRAAAPTRTARSRSRVAHAPARATLGADDAR